MNKLCAAPLLLFLISFNVCGSMPFSRFQERPYTIPHDYESLKKVLISGEILEDRCLLEAELYIRLVQGQGAEHAEYKAVLQLLHFYYDDLTHKCQSSSQWISLVSSAPDSFLWFLKWAAYADAGLHIGMNVRCLQSGLIGVLSSLGYEYAVDCKKRTILKRLLHILTLDTYTKDIL